MSNETRTDSDDHSGPDDGEVDPILQIEDQLFRHRLTLKQHDHKMTSLQDRLSLMIINTISSVFLITTVAAGFAVLLDFFTLAEAFAYIETIAISFGIMAGLVIGLLNVIQWAVDGVESLKKIREGPPEIPTELRSEPDHPGKN